MPTPEPVITESPDFPAGKIRTESYYDAEDRLHREDGPAQVEHLSDGSRQEYHYRHGVPGRPDGPGVTFFRPDGSVYSEEFYRDGHMHREDGPAFIVYESSGNTEAFYLDGDEWSAEGFARYRAAVESGAPHEWAQSYALAEEIS